MIPKKIHYIWLGGKPKSKLTEICINSWYRMLPDYEIVEWNENNLRLDVLRKENKFLDKCIDLKLWAFVSDYLRLRVLYSGGGVYLDTDVEVLRSLTPLLDNKLFMGYEIDGYVGTATIGAEAKNAAVKKLLDFYDNDIWKYDFFNNPIIFKHVITTYPEQFKDCMIYPQEYFSPYQAGNEITGLVEKRNTYTIHWYTKDWNMSRRGYVFLNTKHIKNPIKKQIICIKKSIGYLKYQS